MRKYKEGEIIKSLDELMAQDFIYIHGKVTHIGWVSSWQIRMAYNLINAGEIRKANKNIN